MRTIVKVMVMGMLACTTGCPTQDTVSEMCHRAQECNYLPQGVSVDSCVDDRKRCVDRLTSSQRSDWERMMGTCLENDTCPLLLNCYAQVPWC